MLSRAAMHLHTFGVLSSIEAGNPGFVSDRYLNAINTETSITALELCLAGLWDRVPCGYRVSDSDTMSVATQIHGQLHDLAAQCRAAGGHLCDPQHPNCARGAGVSLDDVAGAARPAASPRRPGLTELRQRFEPTRLPAQLPGSSRSRERRSGASGLAITDFERLRLGFW